MISGLHYYLVVFHLSLFGSQLRNEFRSTKKNCLKYNSRAILRAFFMDMSQNSFSDQALNENRTKNMIFPNEYEK